MAYASLKPLVEKIRNDISALQKGDQKQIQDALNALKRDVQQLWDSMDPCSFTLNNKIK